MAAPIRVVGGIAGRMDGVDRLRQAIQTQERRLRAEVPADREAAVVAVIGAIDRLADTSDVMPPPDVVTGRRLSNSGGGTALRLLLKSDDGQAGSGATSPVEVAAWEDHLVAACGGLDGAKLVLRHVETGFMRAVEDDGAVLDAWVATKHPPAAWIERADVDGWAASLARRHGEALRTARSGVGDGGGYDRLAAVYLEWMA